MNTNNILPVFTSAFSLRSILQIKPQDNPNGPSSIYNIAKKYNLKKILILEHCFTGFLEINKYLSKEFDVIFGICFNCVYSDYTFKINVFARNTNGVKQLQKLFTKYAVDFKSSIPIEELQKYIAANNDLEIVVPFYGSHIYKNLIGSKIFIDFGAIKPHVMIESNGVMFDTALTQVVENYSATNRFPIIKCKTIYYENKKDFQSFQTYRCIMERSKIDKPEMQFMSSDEFCIESWAEKVAE